MGRSSWALASPLDFCRSVRQGQLSFEHPNPIYRKDPMQKVPRSSTACLQAWPWEKEVVPLVEIADNALGMGAVLGMNDSLKLV